MDQFSCASAKSGEIHKAGFVYTVDTTTGTPAVGYNAVTGAEDISYFSFDTSSISDYAEVTGTRLYWPIFSVNSGGPGSPSTWNTSFAIGSFIGAALDSADWAGGTVVQTVSGTPSTQWVDLMAGVPSYVNLSGDTDVRIYDTSTYLFGASNWNHTIRKNSVLLEVSYQLATIRNCRLFNCKIYNA